MTNIFFLYTGGDICTVETQLFLDEKLPGHHVIAQVILQQKPSTPNTISKTFQTLLIFNIANLYFYTQDKVLH